MSNQTPSLPVLIMEAKNISKHYQDNAQIIKVIDQLSLEVPAGEMLAIIGASGSGKSTLLHLLSSLDEPTSGEVVIDGEVLSELTEVQRCKLRNQKLGFIYQFHHLLPEFNVLENVAMPLLLGKTSVKEAKKLALQVLTRVGLAQRTHFRIGQLSGGEKQRVAIARALVTKPRCVLADEPTGNCDDHTAAQLRDLMVSLNQEYGISFIIVTHDLRLAKQMHRTLQLRHGTLHSLN